MEEQSSKGLLRGYEKDKQKEIDLFLLLFVAVLFLRTRLGINNEAIA